MLVCHITVSYTHLDVYKRQYQKCVLRNCTGKANKTAHRRRVHFINGQYIPLLKVIYLAIKFWLCSLLTSILCDLILFLHAWRYGNTDIFRDTKMVLQFTFSLYTQFNQVSVTIHHCWWNMDLPLFIRDGTAIQAMVRSRQKCSKEGENVPISWEDDDNFCCYWLSLIHI